MTAYSRFTQNTRRYYGDSRADIARAKLFVESSGLIIYGKLADSPDNESGEPEYLLRVELGDGRKFKKIHSVGRTEPVGFILRLVYCVRKYHSYPLLYERFGKEVKLAQEIFGPLYSHMIFPNKTLLEKILSR